MCPGRCPHLLAEFLCAGQGVDNGVPVIKVKDIVGGRIVQDNLLLTDRRIDRQYRRSRLAVNGDLVITIRGRQLEGSRWCHWSSTAQTSRRTQSRVRLTA